MIANSHLIRMEATAESCLQLDSEPNQHHHSVVSLLQLEIESRLLFGMEVELVIVVAQTD